MEKQKRWQFYLILTVTILTLFNILPTVFYYMKPLKAPVDAARAEAVAKDIIQRVNGLEEGAEEWLRSYSHLLGLKPISVVLQKDHPGLIKIEFKNPREALLFTRHLPRAGLSIPFVPAQLSLYDSKELPENTVLVSRQINVHLDPHAVSNYFHYFPKITPEGEIHPLYRNQINDRAKALMLAFAGPSKQALQITAIGQNVEDPRYNTMVISLANEIAHIVDTFGKESPVAQRYFASFSQSNEKEFDILFQKAIARFNVLKKELEKEKKGLEGEKNLEDDRKVHLATLKNQISSLEKASELFQKHGAFFKSGKKPLKSSEIERLLNTTWEGVTLKNPIQSLDFAGYNPFFSKIGIDWGNDQLLAYFYQDIETIRSQEKQTENAALERDAINQYLINEMARVSRLTDETFTSSGNEFTAALTTLPNTQSFLAFDLAFLAKQQSEQILNQLTSSWDPQHPDLKSKVYPILPYEQLKTLALQEQKLGLFVYAPAASNEEPPQGFRRGSLYVIARGLEPVIQKYREAPQAPGGEQLMQDIEALSNILKNQEFIAYQGSSSGIDPTFSQDIIFELDDPYSVLLSATQEKFYVKGNQQNALLDFTDVEQRIITTNRIEDSVQENLLKWRDEYNAAQASLNPAQRYDVPAPTKNVYWENLKLSFRKYFRGDDRKILRWGLDLSGGKTVRIGLRDSNGRPVSDPEDLKTAVNELYTRINKMGVAERTIRVENQHIILDFPGSQALSAADLVKASAMYFHIVNEKFTPNNPQLKNEVNQFLQNIWNEAVVTNKKDIQSINEIAWEQLGGNLQTGEMGQVRNEIAKVLYDHGLRLAHPRQANKSNAFDDTFSSIAIMKEEDRTEWDGQTHPLLIIFHNYALEGSSLTNIQTGYDPSEGNILSFSIKRGYDTGAHRSGNSNPRDDFYAWTSQFSEDKIGGTLKETYSQGRGWRMAVILNDIVVTKPSLRASLRDAATISGRFSQREISQLAADLKAGSLSFTPRILSEQNVSAELGQKERTQGIVASLIAFLFVALAMIGYYRFAGIVATCAVLFNLLIMWGVLQNLGAALTLPGIAGIVLTIGMAVDANVLVFERIREEFALSGRIASAIHAGYRKAFSAIFDSNITTIIAALILIQFDSGPIRGFATTLIIGVASSMFTALFMTRYYFAGWIQNPKNRSLTMSHWIKNTKIDFLGYTKPAVIISLLIMIGGSYLLYTQRHSMLGMDFTGGYSLTAELVEMPGKGEDDYREEASKALLKAGASSTDFEIRRLSKPNELRFQLSLRMEEKGHPFHELPLVLKEGEFTYDYQKDPRIVWVVNALLDENLSIQETHLKNLDEHWSMMSGQFSERMQTNALIALGLALFSILIYITLRFEFKYAIGAVVGLVHDVIISLGIYALFHKLGFPVQIDLEVVGAIMTIIGYSLNDTIIVFDRIREEIKIFKKMAFPDIINHALNVTLSRTFMTGGTTLLVLIALVLFGGQSIFDFSLMMTIGIFVGTFSSLFIASPVMLFFHYREKMTLKKA